MKLLLPLAAALQALLTSCTVPRDGDVYGSASYGYNTGGYGDSFYDSGYYWNGHEYCRRPSSHARHVRTPFSSKDDERKDAEHRTSPSYRDPHHGGSNHGHDAAGHRIDSHGHHVDSAGRHTSSPEMSSHSRSSDDSSSSPSRAPEPSRQEASRGDDSNSSRGENKADDIGRRGKD